MLWFLLACRVGAKGVDCEAGVSAGTQTCLLPGHKGRDFLLHLPPGWDGSALPLLLSFHGGGGNKDGANRSTCPKGDEGSDGCLYAVADRRGWIVVQPDGTPSLLAPNKRTWNAGGGEGDWQCVSGQACKTGVDDVAYVDDLLSELRKVLTLDESRIFAVGISNGGAMSYRLACERSAVFAGIASVGGGNQVAQVQGCHPTRSVPVLEIHGTDDRCWPFEGGEESCLQKGGSKVSVEQSLVGDSATPGWSALDGCSGDPVATELPDSTKDGIHTTQEDWPGCRVRLLKVEGGGHAWPDGWQYLGASVIGPVTTDFRGTEAVFDFFDGG
jgi:polyhydroxybutyrate depolymerase